MLLFSTKTKRHGGFLGTDVTEAPDYNRLLIIS